jgi:hypothetical protein
MSRSLHVLSDAQGTVSFGFLAANVYYLRIEGFLSAKVGIDCAVKLRQELSFGTEVACFADVASAEGGAFAARSAVMRALLANRRQLSNMTILAAANPSGTRARSMAVMLGRPSTIIESPALFQTQLREAVPSARSKTAPPSGTVRIGRAVRTSARPSRPRARTA